MLSHLRNLESFQFRNSGSRSGASLQNNIYTVESNAVTLRRCDNVVAHQLMLCHSSGRITVTVYKQQVPLLYHDALDRVCWHAADAKTGRKDLLYITDDDLDIVMLHTGAHVEMQHFANTDWQESLLDARHPPARQ